MKKINTDYLITAIANRGITMVELSKRADISRTTIYRIINKKSKPTLIVIGKLARALNISVDELFLNEK